MSLGIFKYNPIISNEELETIKAISKIQLMPIYPKELLLGSDKMLDQMEPNNTKFDNLILFPEEERQVVYLAPSSSRTTTENGSFSENLKDRKATPIPSIGGASVTQSSQASYSSQMH